MDLTKVFLCQIRLRYIEVQLCMLYCKAWCVVMFKVHDLLFLHALCNFFCHLPRPRLYVCDVSYAHARVYLSFCLFGNNKGIIYSSHCMLEIVVLFWSAFCSLCWVQVLHSVSISMSLCLNKHLMFCWNAVAWIFIYIFQYLSLGEDSNRMFLNKCDWVEFPFSILDRMTVIIHLQESRSYDIRCLFMNKLLILKHYM